MELSLSDAVVLVLPAFLVACGVLYGVARRRRITRGRPRLTCAEALEPAGLKLEPDTYCDYALKLLPQSDMYAFPVIVGNRFLGFFARTDVLKCADRDLGSTYVGTVMTAAAYCAHVSANTSLEGARRQLRASPYAMLPVLGKNNDLLGFITEDGIRRVARHALPSSTGATA